MIFSLSFLEPLLKVYFIDKSFSRYARSWQLSSFVRFLWRIVLFLYVSSIFLQFFSNTIESLFIDKNLSHCARLKSVFTLACYYIMLYFLYSESNDSFLQFISCSRKVCLLKKLHSFRSFVFTFFTRSLWHYVVFLILNSIVFFAIF